MDSYAWPSAECFDDDPADQRSRWSREVLPMVPLAASGFERFAAASDRQQRQLLRGLPVADQAVVIMAANGYWPYEIARATHQPLATVQSTMIRLDADLRRRWHPERLQVVRRDR